MRIKIILNQVIEERESILAQQSILNNFNPIQTESKPRLALLDLLLDLNRRGLMNRNEVRQQVDTFMLEVS